MRHSKKIKNFIKQFESFSPYPYQDQAGNWTIGYGKRMSSPGEYRMISKETAELLLNEELNRIGQFISRCIKINLSQRQHDAFVSLSYNIGVWGFYYSTARQRLNDGMSPGDVAEAILWWNKVTIEGSKVISAGLLRRRCAEVLIFIGDDPVTGYTENMDMALI